MNVLKALAAGNCFNLRSGLLAAKAYVVDHRSEATLILGHLIFNFLSFSITLVDILLLKAVSVKTIPLVAGAVN